MTESTYLTDLLLSEVNIPEQVQITALIDPNQPKRDLCQLNLSAIHLAERQFCDFTGVGGRHHFKRSML